MLKKYLGAMALLALSMTTYAQQAPTLGLGGTGTPPTRKPAALKKYDTPYYTLYTDVSEAEARETDLRMTRMFEEYQKRTAGFAGQVKEKFPFYLFRHEEDYYAAGAPPKSGGVYIRSSNPKRLMAIAGDKVDDNTWSTIQHEGFHQFVDASVKAELPTWCNEGLAEYFGEALWTGDGFVTDLIPQERLLKVRKGIQSKFRTFKDLMSMDGHTWIENLDGTNYDESWAMIHFIANADNGKYQTPFLNFMKQVAKGTDGQVAWENVFGKDSSAFQNRFAQWWLALPDRPTAMGFVKAMMQTETSFLARATLQRLQFQDPETFFSKYQPGGMALTREQWLPPGLFEDYRDIALSSGGWQLDNGRLPRLSLTLADGTKMIGTFALGNGKVTQVNVQVIPSPNNAASAASR